MDQNRNFPFLVIALALAPLVVMMGGIWCCLQQAGFSSDKITAHLRYNEDWEVPSISEGQRGFLLSTVFAQPYDFLASGRQCYAFISQDRSFVIKFFKPQQLFQEKHERNALMKRLTACFDRENSQEPLFYERMFISYKQAYLELKEETGLLYVHFNRTSDLRTKVQLTDSKGQRYWISLDNVEFVVQRRAEKLFDVLTELAVREQWEAFRVHLRAFFDVVAARCCKGFVDSHMRVRNNFGFSLGKAILIGCGALSKDESMKYPANFKEEILRVAEQLDLWAQRYAPDACLLIQEEAQQTINANREK